MAVAEIALNLNVSIENIMGDHTEFGNTAGIEQSISRTFQALPKNHLGRLAPRAVRFIAHNYFLSFFGAVAALNSFLCFFKSWAT